jgi:chloramphenicol 3-O phosphotransferase
MVAPGRVVVINGTSSAGKTALAEAFQDVRAAAGECWLVFGIDDFLPRLPRRWVAYDAWSGSLAGDGVRLERDGDRARYRIGALGRRVLSAYRRSVAEIARAGLNVLVDDVTIEEHEWEEWCAVLAGLHPVWVALRCDAGVAMAREAARGDRARGLVRGVVDLVHRFPVYDLELDSTATSAADLAAQLNAYLGEAETPAG